MNLLNLLILAMDQSFLLTSGLYELRLGVDNSESINSFSSSIYRDQLSNNTNLNSSELTSTGHHHQWTQTDPKLGEMNVSGTCSGRVEWRRIRFPKSSKAQDEYTRWPSIRFRVQYLQPIGSPNKSTSHLVNSNLSCKFVFF